MQINQIYETYFDKEECNTGYQNDFDFMNNLFQVLDVILFIAMNQNKLSMEEQEELMKMVQAHLRGRLDETFFPYSLHLLALKEMEYLSEWEIFCILVGAASNFHNKYEKAFAILQNSEKMRYASYGLVCNLFEISKFAKTGTILPFDISEEFASRYFILNEDVWKQVALYQKPLMTKRRVCSWLCGDDALPYELAGWCELFRGEEKKITLLGAEKEQKQLADLLAYGEKLPIIVLEGKNYCGRKQLLKKIMSDRQEDVIFAEFEEIAHLENAKDKIDALLLEGILQNCPICIWNCFESDSMRYILRKRRRHNLFLTTDENYGNKLGNQYAVFKLMIPACTTQDKIAIWRYFLELYQAVDIDPVSFSNKYVLNAGEIEKIMHYAKTLAQSFGRKQILEQDIIMSIKKKNTVALGPFAELLEIKANWEDLIVEPEVRTQLQYICNRIIYKNVVGYEWGFSQKAAYGKGTCALFYGPPGTGKTMAAQVLANELGLDLYRIDIARMISKYIGETQKHISELFEKAEDSNALLFFDEADAFFSKRTDVSDANDRNANAEVAHLLQKLESYEGISILATNLNDNIDNAFKRRINYMVHFQLPDKFTRRVFWQKMIPQEAPIGEGLDLNYFAEHFEISGSEIKECMFHAAYMAASEGSAIENRHIMEALKLCMGKYGKILTRDDFGYLM